MYSFFGRNSLPHPRLLGVWRSVDASVEALRSMANGSALARAHDEAEAHADVRARAAASVAAVAAAAFTKLSNLSRIRPSLPALHVSSPQPLEYKWPLFIKACHLTMGGAHSVKMLRSPDWVQALVSAMMRGHTQACAPAIAWIFKHAHQNERHLGSCADLSMCFLSIRAFRHAYFHLFVSSLAFTSSMCSRNLCFLLCAASLNLYV
eukprot:6191641-Pleurochrysis_carterae.AAC.2